MDLHLPMDGVEADVPVTPPPEPSRVETAVPRWFPPSRSAAHAIFAGYHRPRVGSGPRPRPRLSLGAKAEERPRSRFARLDELHRARSDPTELGPGAGPEPVMECTGACSLPRSKPIKLATLLGARSSSLASTSSTTSTTSTSTVHDDSADVHAKVYSPREHRHLTKSPSHSSSLGTAEGEGPSPDSSSSSCWRWLPSHARGLLGLVREFPILFSVCVHVCVCVALFQLPPFPLFPLMGAFASSHAPPSPLPSTVRRSA
jgi:hypothetical protein